MALTTNDIILFFGRYTEDIYFNIKELKEFIEYFQKELNKVIEIMIEIERTYKIQDIKTYYFDEFFYIRMDSGRKIFNLTAFLQFACCEYKELKSDIKYCMW